MIHSPGNLIAVPASRRSKLEEIVRRATSARRVVLTTHINADGDGAGSEAALGAWLERQGVHVTIVNPTPFPDYFRFLLHRQDVVVDGCDGRAAGVIAEADLAIVLDTSEAGRIAPLDTLLAAVPTVVIDHHPPGPTVVGEGIQDVEAAATGELVYDMIAGMGGDWPPAAAAGVYVAIVSDTGSFRFSNTTPRAHAIAAEMLSRGVDPEEIFERLFATAPMRRLELLREALARLEYDKELGVAWMVVPKEITDKLRSTNDDYEGLIDHARSLDGCRVAILFRETGPAETKVSLRSSGPIDVNRIARPFEVGVPRQPLDVVGDEGVRLLPGEPFGALDLAAEGRDQRLRVELHVVQHLGDRVAVHEVGDLVAPRPLASRRCTALVSPKRLCRSPRISWYAPVRKIPRMYWSPFGTSECSSSVRLPYARR
jgi:bifunctional oligoribonuclease and PAP phosphatase NrnA